MQSWETCGGRRNARSYRIAESSLVITSSRILLFSLALNGRQHLAGGLAHQSPIDSNLLPFTSFAAGRVGGEILLRLLV